MPKKQLMDNIYLFTGTDRYSINEHIQTIIEGCKNPVVIKYDSKKIPIEAVVNEIRFRDLFSPSKVIIIEYDVFHAGKDEQSLFADVLKLFPENNIVIFICPKVLKSASINRRIFSKTDNVFTYGQPKNSNKKEVVTYVYATLQHKDIKITKALVELTVELMGFDASSILFEVTRLYRKYNTITEKILKEHIPKTHFSMFDIMDVFAKRDIKRTLTMYDAYIEAGFNFHEIFISIYRQVRLLFLIKTLNVSYGMRDYRQIATALNLHPFQIKKNLGYINSYSYEELSDAFKIMLDYQRKMYKNSNNSPMILKVMITELLSK